MVVAVVAVAVAVVVGVVVTWLQLPAVVRPVVVVELGKVVFVGWG